MEPFASSDIGKNLTVSIGDQLAAFTPSLENMDDIQEYGVLTGTDFLDADASTAPFSWPAFRRDHDYADLLSELPEESDVLKETVVPSPLLVVFLPVPAPPAPAPIKPRGSVSNAAIPMYDLWVTVLRDQPRPKRADEFLPKLKRIFVEEGVPAELAWIPEIESMFNPRARHPGGACGLFQLMPITARAQGLRLRPYDERTNPEKSARAAATLLRELHEMFDSWPLAIAAYNAGEGCVRRTLRARDATTFAEIADRLPVETRLYVPRVFATLAIREGVSPASLPAPRYIAQTGF